MTTYEKIDAIKTTLNQETFSDDYKMANLELIDIFGNYIDKALVNCIAYGKGVVTGYSGETFADLTVSIDFSGTTKYFSLNHIITHAKFVVFVNPEIAETYNKAWTVYEKLTEQFNTFSELEKQAAVEAAKRAEAEKKAEAKYQKQKEKAIKDFEALTNRAKETITQVDEFYYALGWLAKHVGSMTARLPDYLSDTFKKHFGEDVQYTAIDSKKRTVNGNSMQWTFGFQATLRKAESIPAILTPYLNSTGKALANTSFIWDLVDDYGFQFGKKQDVDKIKETIPSQYISYFEKGLNS